MYFQQHIQTTENIMYVYMPTHKHMHVQVYDMYSYVSVYTHTHTHTHTHTRYPSLSLICVGVHPFHLIEHHVVLHVWSTGGGYLEYL